MPDENNNNKYLMFKMCHEQIDEMPDGRNITKNFDQKETILRLIYPSRNEWS